MARWILRYRPYLIAVVAALLIVWQPGSRHAGRPSTTTRTGAVTNAAAGPGAAEDQPSAPGDSSPGPAASPAGTTAPTVRPASGPATGAVGSPATKASSTGPARPATATAGETARVTSAGIGTPDALAAPDCDRARGRIKVASIYAPPCVAAWPQGADNGGATTPGVTGTAIKVVAISAATAPGDAQKEQASWNDYVAMYEHLFRTWGRHMETTWFTPSGTDETSQRADAIKIASLKPFAVLAAGTSLNQDTMVAELAARKIVVCCYTAITLPKAKALAPYLWGTVLGSPEDFEFNLAQYVGTRLLGKNAHWAGQADYQVTPRKFGLIYPNTWSDLSVFTNEFGRFGGKLTEAMPYAYESSQYAAYQERARTIVAKMKSEGVTTVLNAGGLVFDPITTKEATSQQWFPEWVIAGTGGQDLDIVGRLNDPAQWQHAFGLSSFAVGGDKPIPLDQLYDWYWGLNRGTRSLSYSALNVFYWGVHGAGPALTPLSFRDALFALPPTGGAATGGLMSTQISFGRHGVFPWDDYNQGDDFAEVYWDPTAQGKDSLSCSAGACAQGVGKYRFLDGGKRYAPFKWPSGEPAFFDPKGTVLWYADYPPADAPPSYPCTGCPSQG